MDLIEKIIRARCFALPFAASAAYPAPVFGFRASLLAFFVIGSGIGVASSAAAEETAPVQRIVVNRIVAVVDQDVITLVELKRRAEPFQKRLAEVPVDKRTAAESQLHRDLIKEAIDERLIARDARTLHVAIASTEIDATLDAIAKAKNITREKLLDLAVAQGFSEVQYREQIVRQLLIGKMVRIRMAEQLKNLDKDPEKSAKQMEKIEKNYLSSLRANVFIEVRL